MHVVLFGEAGQTLRHTAPVVVPSATYEIVDLPKALDDADRVLASGAATVPGWLLVLDGDAGPEQPDARLLPVAATVGPALGDTAILTAVSGSFEAVDVRGIAAGDSLELTSGLAGAYTTGDTVQGATLTASIPAAVYDFEDALDDQRPLAVVWSYAVGAGVVRVIEELRLARTNVAASQAAEAAKMVRRRWPDLAPRLTSGLSLDALAHHSAEWIRAEIELRCEYPERLMTGKPGAWLLYARIVHEAAVGGWSPNTRDLSRFVDATATEYSRRLEALVVGYPGVGALSVTTGTTADTTPNRVPRSPVSFAR